MKPPEAIRDECPLGPDIHKARYLMCACCSLTAADGRQVWVFSHSRPSLPFLGWWSLALVDRIPARLPSWVCVQIHTLLSYTLCHHTLRVDSCLAQPL